MSVDLIGAGGDLRTNMNTFAAMLDLAHEHGWTPQGTKYPLFWAEPEWDVSPDEWHGGYFTNDFQRVTDEDAKAIAAALGRVIFPPDNLTVNAISRFRDYFEEGEFIIA